MAIEPTTSCHICDVQSPTRVGTIQAVIISENDGNVIIENADQPLSIGDTVEWCVSKDLKHKWSVQFLDDPLNSFTFNLDRCGFKVTNLPSGVYRYRAYVNGIANSAQGSISIP